MPDLLAPVLWSAGDLLAETRRDCVRLCANEECIWLFLDDSKSGTRRWCDMKACGNLRPPAETSKISGARDGSEASTVARSPSMTTEYPFRRERASRAAVPPCNLAPPLKEAWKVYQRGIGSYLPFLESQGMVFLNQGGKLVARDALSRKRLWTYPRNTSPGFIHGARLYAWVGSDTAAILDLASGREVGRIDAPCYIDPLVVGDRLVGSNHASIHAHDLRDGRLLWSSSTVSRVSTVLCATPTGVFVGLDDNTLLGLSLEDGSKLWQEGLGLYRDKGDPRDARGVISAYGDTIVVRCGPEIVGVSARDGEILWVTWCDDVLLDGYLYGDRYYTIGNWGTYQIIDPGKGEVVLEANFLKDAPARMRKNSWLHYPLLISETHGFTGNNMGRIIVFERETGKYVCSHRPQVASAFQQQTYFASVGGRFYFTNMSGWFFCLEGAQEGAAAGAIPDVGDAKANDSDEESQLALTLTVVGEGRELLGKAPYHRKKKGGAYTVFECRVTGVMGAIVHFATAIDADRGGDGRLWVRTVKEGDAVLKAARKAFPARVRRGKGVGVQPPAQFALMVLGRGNDGHSIQTKWTSETGDVEFFWNLRIEGNAGAVEILEKDEAYRIGLLRLLAGLGARG